MSKMLQRILLAVGVIAFLILLIEIGLSIAATFPGNTPARVAHVDAGPYPLTVNLYKDPANAGFAEIIHGCPYKIANNITVVLNEFPIGKCIARV